MGGKMSGDGNNNFGQTDLGFGPSFFFGAISGLTLLKVSMRLVVSFLGFYLLTSDEQFVLIFSL